MSLILIRYESIYKSLLSLPFETAYRHAKVAVCDGKEETLVKLAKERIIYRSEASKNTYKPLSNKDRLFHASMAIVQSGCLFPLTGHTAFLLIPHVAALAEKTLLKPWYPKGAPEFQTHMEEGGTLFAKEWRKNPFHPNGKEDPFYSDSSWIKYS